MAIRSGILPAHWDGERVRIYSHGEQYVGDLVLAHTHGLVIEVDHPTLVDGNAIYFPWSATDQVALVIEEVVGQPL